MRNVVAWLFISLDGIVESPHLWQEGLMDDDMMRDITTQIDAEGAILMGRVTSPSQAAARAEMSDQVERAIAAMDPLDQEVLALRHFEELTNSEVAEVLGIQQKAASIRYVRAIKRLKAVTSHLPGFSEG